MKVRRHPATVKWPSCPVCGTPFDFNRKRSNYYCSAKCRQQAYRDRKVSPMERAILHKDADRRRVQTKAAQRLEMACAHCGHPFFRSGLETNRIYCSDRCKAAAWRKRHPRRPAELGDRS